MSDKCGKCGRFDVSSAPPHDQPLPPNATEEDALRRQLNKLEQVVIEQGKIIADLRTQVS